MSVRRLVRGIATGIVVLLALGASAALAAAPDDSKNVDLVYGAF